MELNYFAQFFFILILIPLFFPALGVTTCFAFGGVCFTTGLSFTTSALSTVLATFFGTSNSGDFTTRFRPRPIAEFVAALLVEGIGSEILAGTGFVGVVLAAFELQ